MTAEQLREAMAMIDEWGVKARRAFQLAQHQLDHGHMAMAIRIDMDRKGLVEIVAGQSGTDTVAILRGNGVVDEELAAMMAMMRARIYRPGDASADSTADL